ncbi:unnamed protein product [Merluccius merluccius]
MLTSMMLSFRGNGGGGGGRRRRRTRPAATGTFLSACLISACQALRTCGEVQCGDGQQCCPPITVTGAGTGNVNVNASGGVGVGGVGGVVRCCKLPIHVFFDNVGWVTRKLSGILILLLLFAMGYFIQRIICPRPPRRHPGHERPEEPSSSSLFQRHHQHHQHHQHHRHHHHHATTSASQDSLLDRYPDCYSIGDFASPSLPSYDEVKHLPTYEESMREMRRDRSDEDLLLGDPDPPGRRTSTAGTSNGAAASAIEVAGGGGSRSREQRQDGSEEEEEEEEEDGEEEEVEVCVAGHGRRLRAVPRNSV